MGQERQVIITDQGIEILKSTMVERLAGRVLLNRFGKVLALSALKITGTEQASDPSRISDLIDDIQTMQQIEYDFEKGEINGRVVSAADPTLRNPIFTESRQELRDYRLSRQERGK